MELAPGDEILLRGVQLATEQLGLSTQRNRKRMPSCSAELQRLGSERISKCNHVCIWSRTIQETLCDAKVSVEYAYR